MVRSIPPQDDEYFVATVKLERVSIKPTAGRPLNPTKISFELLSLTVRQRSIAGAVDKAMKAIQLAAEPDIMIVAHDITGDIPQALKNGFTGEEERLEEEDEEDDDEEYQGP